MMTMRLLCPALLVAVLFCDAILAADDFCSIFNREKIGGCNEKKGGTTADPTYIGKPGEDGCNEVCRQKGYQGGCCTLGDEDCWCTLSLNVAKAEAPAKTE